MSPLALLAYLLSVWHVNFWNSKNKKLEKAYVMYFTYTKKNFLLILLMFVGCLFIIKLKFRLDILL